MELFLPQKKNPKKITGFWKRPVAEMCRADLRFVKLLSNQTHESRPIQLTSHETVLQSFAPPRDFSESFHEIVIGL